MSDVNAAAAPFLKGNASGPEMTAWAEMLSMIGRKNSQLSDFIARRSRPRTAGNTVLRELERERSRIARELHAGAGQPLAGIKLNLEMLDDCMAALPPKGREALARVQTLTDQALEQIRSVSHGLLPPAWQSLTTVESIRNLVDSSGLATRIDVRLDLERLAAEPPHSTKIALYRCAQECISNVMRHACATRFTLSLLPHGSMVQLQVEDNGRGFSNGTRNKGIGLRALHDHANALGGSCDVASGPTGTRVAVLLPLTED